MNEKSVSEFDKGSVWHVGLPHICVYLNFLCTCSIKYLNLGPHLSSHALDAPQSQA